jgi:hypothetical protein
MGKKLFIAIQSPGGDYQHDPWSPTAEFHDRFVARQQEVEMHHEY